MVWHSHLLNSRTEAEWYGTAVGSTYVLRPNGMAQLSV